MVKSKEDAIEGICDAVSQADGLSTAALEQAIALKNDVSKGAKSRKKKALTDFFKALEACGISKLQTAVGINDRDPRRWMTVDYEGVSDSSYYYESIARLNRLREVSQQPHQDVQAREIHMANNMMTHAVHRVQETRWAFISARIAKRPAHPPMVTRSEDERVRPGGVSEKLRGAKRPAHPPMVTRSQLLDFDWVG